MQGLSSEARIVSRWSDSCNKKFLGFKDSLANPLFRLPIAAHGVTFVIGRSLALLAKDILLPGNRVYGSVWQSGDGVC